MWSRRCGMRSNDFAKLRKLGNKGKIMKNKMVWVVTAAAMFTAMTVSAADKETKKERQAVRAERRAEKVDIDKRIDAVNRLDNKPAAMQAGLAEVSRETAVPLQKIQAEHKEHPKVGLAGLFVAH